MTAPAWQVRESQRQDRLEMVMRKALDAWEELSGEGIRRESFFAQLIVILLEGLFPYDQPRREKHTFVYQLARRFCDNVVKVDLGVATFARSEEEARSLTATLIEKYLLNAALNGAHAGLQRQQSRDPMKIYHAESATDEIEFTREES